MMEDISPCFLNPETIGICGEGTSLILGKLSLHFQSGIARFYFLPFVVGGSM
jgi:hypothetical protein